MRPGLKVALSLLITTIIFSLFFFLAFSGLFFFLETKFYSPRAKNEVINNLERINTEISKFHSDNINIFTKSLQENYITRSFISTQLSEDIQSREIDFYELKQKYPIINFVRFIGVEGKRIHYSTLETDIKHKTSNSIVYYNFSEIDQYPIKEVIDFEDNDVKILLDENTDSYIYSISIIDNFNIKLGEALFYIDIEGLKNYIINNIENVFGDIIIIKNLGIIVDFHKENITVIKEQIINIWENDYIENEILNSIDAEENFAKLILFSVFEQKYGFIGVIVPETEFEMKQYMKVILMAAFFLTLFLIIFILFNIKKDNIAIFTNRIKKFQIQFLIEFIESKERFEWNKLKRELKVKSQIIKKQFKTNLGKYNEKYEDQINSLINKSWDEVLNIIGAKDVEDEKFDLSKIEKILKEILRNTKYGVAQAITTKKPPIKRREAEVLEPVEELEDVEELDEVEELDDAEELVEDLEDVEELDEAEDSEDIEDLVEVEELDDVEELTEELEDVEELDEAEELEEAIGLVEAEKLKDSKKLENIEELELVEEIKTLPKEPYEELDELEDAEDEKKIEKEEIATLAIVEPTLEYKEEAQEAKYVETIKKEETEEEELEELKDAEELVDIEELEDESEAAENQSKDKATEIIDTLEPIEVLEEVEEISTLTPEPFEKLEMLDLVEETDKNGEYNEKEDYNKNLEHFSISELVEKVEEENTAIIMEDGIYRIKDEVFLRRGSRKNKEIGLLSKAILGEWKSTMKVKDVVKIPVIEKKGLSLDYNFEKYKYKNSDLEKTKFLVNMSRMINAICMVILKKEENEYITDISIGIDNESIEKLRFSDKDYIFKNYLNKKDFVIYDKEVIKNPVLSKKFSDNDTKYFKSIAIFPSIFNNEESFILFGFGEKTDIKLENIIKKLNIV